MARAVLLGPVLALGLMAPPAAAEAPQALASVEQTEALIDVIGIDSLLPILRDEGRAYGSAIAETMFPGRSLARWQAAVDQIYAIDRMRTVMTAELGARMPAKTIAPLVAFFDSEQGRRIIELEVTARAAMLDDDVEAATMADYAEMVLQGDPRLDLLDAFIEANDMIERNVAGSLNASLGFYQGMAAGVPQAGAMSEDEILSEVWSQAETVRADTAEWLYSYLALAYRPLQDSDLTDYIALSRRAEGQALNSALFAAFDVLFVAVSRDLGRAAALMLSGEDI